MKENRRESSPRVVPPQVKDLESLKLNQYIVQLLEVEGKDLQWHQVPVEAIQLNKKKELNARTATNIILVLANG